MPKSEITVAGALLFASSNGLYTQFECAADFDRVVVRPVRLPYRGSLHGRVVDAITHKYERKHKNVEIVGLKEVRAERHERLSGDNFSP